MTDRQIAILSLVLTAASLLAYVYFEIKNTTANG